VSGDDPQKLAEACYEAERDLQRASAQLMLADLSRPPSEESKMSAKQELIAACRQYLAAIDAWARARRRTE
jgi:hypothetical protein